MKFLPSMAALAVTAGLAGSAAAQMPFPFGGPQMPEPGKAPQCTKEYVKSVEAQVRAMQKLRASGPEFVGQVCSLIEAGSAIVGGELSDSTRQQLKGMLGFDVDLRFIKTQCRVSQGNLDREVMTHIGYLKSELTRCNDTI
ncbi:MAG TPA: hypothetical protein VFR73_17385 [Hyphomicrobiaceae bacterium]|jgi:hypothetical protein|nr:hypothetical protein [Hyphomicrobiaceae bacterium]